MPMYVVMIADEVSKTHIKAKIISFTTDHHEQSWSNSNAHFHTTEMLLSLIKRRN